MLPSPLKTTLLSKCAIFYSDLFIIDNRLDITQYLVIISIDVFLNCLNITVLLFLNFFFVNKIAFLTLCSYSITYHKKIIAPKILNSSREPIKFGVISF